MNDHAATGPEPAVTPANLSLDAAAPGPASLEQRVQRLEDAVTGLQDTQRLEDRIVERVQGRLQNPAPATNQVAAGDPPLPQAKETAMPREGIYVPPPPPDSSKIPWLLVDLLNEARAMVRMFFDRRYRVALSTWLIVIFMVPVVLLSHLWFPLAWLPFGLGTLCDKLLDFILIFLAYKVLSREARALCEIPQRGVIRILMAKPPSQERFWFIILDQENARIRCSYQRRGKGIKHFVVQLEIEHEGSWQAVMRYDNAHGFCHRDTFHPDGKQEKTPLAKGSTNETFTFAVEELRTNWKTHRARYLGEIQK